MLESGEFFILFFINILKEILVIRFFQKENQSKT